MPDWGRPRVEDSVESESTGVGREGEKLASSIACFSSLSALPFPQSFEEDQFRVLPHSLLRLPLYGSRYGALCFHSHHSASHKALPLAHMPLLKRKPYDLSKPPDNLKPKELVFQVRFTKEIFRDYEEYLKRINLYRQRVWTCKYTGKINLTYEEALVSERKATEKVQQFPKEFMGPVLHLVQFSMLRLDDLVSAILKAFKDCFVVGEEVDCVKENVTMPCKVMGVNEGQDHENGISSYEVGWLDNDKNVVRKSVESTHSLVRKKVPFTRALVKSFIRESVKDNASRNSQTPLVVLEKLCHKYGITTDPPEELMKFFVKQESSNKEANGAIKRPLVEDTKPENHVNKKQKKMDTEELGEGGTASEDNKSKVKTDPIVKVLPIKYPIEDSLIQPSPNEPPLPERPVPSSDFPLSMDCTGQLLMVWNFCSLFGKVIRLSPFSLEEFEKALECKETDPILLREAHHALLKLALSDPAVNQSFQEKRKRKSKVTIQTWKDDLSDFLKLEGFEKLALHSSTIAKGNYRLLEPSTKLDILCQLVEWVLGSTAIRDQLDAYIEEKQAIASQKRKEEMEESKRGKEAQERLKQAQSTDIA